MYNVLLEQFLIAQFYGPGQGISCLLFHVRKSDFLGDDLDIGALNEEQLEQESNNGANTIASITQEWIVYLSTILLESETFIP